MPSINKLVEATETGLVSFPYDSLETHSFVMPLCPLVLQSEKEANFPNSLSRFCSHWADPAEQNMEIRFN